MPLFRFFGDSFETSMENVKEVANYLAMIDLIDDVLQEDDENFSIHSYTVIIEPFNKDPRNNWTNFIVRANNLGIIGFLSDNFEIKKEEKSDVEVNQLKDSTVSQITNLFSSYGDYLPLFSAGT